MHCLSRAEAYPAFLPPERVNWRPLAERQAQWREFLSDPGYGHDRFLVVLETDGIVGFAGGGPERYGDPGLPGEVWSIYLLRAWQGQGHGRRLMSEMAQRLLGAGHGGLMVWTQALNAPARGFYKRLEGVYVRTRTTAGFEVVGYGWQDARALL